MLQIIPIASPIHPPGATKRVLGEIAEQLRRSGMDHRYIESAAGGDGESPCAVLVVTGGTEHLVMKQLENWDAPVILLAHPHGNSFPAALEILALLRQEKKKGNIVMLGQAGEGPQRLERLVRAVQANKRMARSKIGIIGEPSDWLIASRRKPEKRDSMYPAQWVDISLDELTQAMDHADEEEARAYAKEVSSAAAGTREASSEDIFNASKVTVALKEVVTKHGLDACTVRCFDLVTDRKVTGCLGLSRLIDEGVIAGCEGDVPATLTMLWMSYLTGEIPFMANPQDVSVADNTVDIAHCTIAQKLLDGFHLRSHFESGLGVGIQGTVAPKDVTLARIGGRDFDSLFVSNGEIVSGGAHEQRCRTQLTLRLDEDVNYFLTSPLGNHHVMIPGHWKEELTAYYNLFRLV